MTLFMTGCCYNVVCRRSDYRGQLDEAKKRVGDKATLMQDLSPDVERLEDVVLEDRTADTVLRSVAPVRIGYL